MRNYFMKLVLLAGLVAVFGMTSAVGSDAATSTQDKPSVELYVTSWCPYCTKAKAFFDQRGIEYQLYDIERDSAAAQRKQQLDSGRGVPFAVINGTAISGWSQQAYQTALEN